MKLVLGLLGLALTLVRKSVKLAILSAVAAGLLVILDTLLLDEKPERRG